MLKYTSSELETVKPQNLQPIKLCLTLGTHIFALHWWANIWKNAVEEWEKLPGSPQSGKHCSFKLQLQKGTVECVYIPSKPHWKVAPPIKPIVWWRQDSAVKRKN